MKVAALVDVPACFRGTAFLKLRNEWYRRAEASGIEIDELGYKNGRERAKRAGVHVTDRVRAENAVESGRGSLHDLDTAEYWRLVSDEVEKLPENYYGKAFLRLWSELGDVKNAAAQLGVSRWHARRLVETFVNMLKRKRVLR